MKIRNIQAMVLATGLVGAVSAYSAQLDVCGTCAYTTIGDAVVAASAGDSVYIHNGTYNEDDIFIDKELTVFGQSQGGVIVDAGGNGRHFSVDNAAGSATFAYMTLTNGTTVGASNHCQIFAHNRGGSICAADIGMKVWKVTFTDNYSEAIGGAIYMGGDTGGAYTNGDLIVAKSTFRNNSLGGTTSNGAEGGAIACGYCDYVDLFKNVFTENTAGAFPTSSGTYKGNGGAVGVWGSVKVSSQRNTYQYNDASERGGAISLDAEDIIIANDTYFKNYSGEKGGAVRIHRSLVSSSETKIKRSTFEKNASEYGGALEIGSDTYIDNSTFTDNFAYANGGAIIYTRAYVPLKIANATFMRNDTKGANGGSVMYFGALTNDGDIHTNNSLFSQNSGVECEFSSSGIVVGEHNLGDSYSCDPLNGSASAAYGYTLPFILASASNVDPILSNNGGYTKTHELLAGSNAIDAGAQSCPSAITGTPLTRDQRGFARVKYCDIGAYER